MAYTLFVRDAKGKVLVTKPLKQYARMSTTGAMHEREMRAQFATQPNAKTATIEFRRADGSLASVHSFENRDGRSWHVGFRVFDAKGTEVHDK